MWYSFYIRYKSYIRCKICCKRIMHYTVKSKQFENLHIFHLFLSSPSDHQQGSDICRINGSSKWREERCFIHSVSGSKMDFLMPILLLLLSWSLRWWFNVRSTLTDYSSVLLIGQVYLIRQIVISTTHKLGQKVLHQQMVMILIIQPS